ncbi:hypothetical protein SAMN02745126_06359 [Enhydrobacter aerosaccus]|uniref:Uncharacterized protein n=1 Tax=Enhydrobacter aerosaccus TaxID=225324 RepID=A0A1T4TJL9_9HYPH|nr:hypothetical protein [Enhydrobacter aerosaccus]SKA40461.1 hypothetical protein SAMN02745126_06359 [Enhydrobacter aerosaccus]
MTTVVTLNAQERANQAARTTARRENLYGEFIEESSKLYTDALVHELGDMSKFVRLYALQSKLRLFASATVLSQADVVLQRIMETYLNPQKDLQVILNGPTARDMDILRSFSEACRRDLNG